MEVILRETVDNLGKRGEVVKVADGYARNYLLPRKLALLATEGNKKHVERERKIVEVRESEEKGQAESIAARLAAVDITIAAPRGRDRSPVWVGHQRRYRRLPADEGFRDRSPQADPARNRSRRSASTTSR